MNVGYGYRLMKVGERATEGTEVFQSHHGKWQYAGIGYKIDDYCLPHRCKIDPGEGWEIVPESELDTVPPERGLEYWSSAKGCWLPFGNLSRETFRCWSNLWNRNCIDMLAFRRPISKPVEPMREVFTVTDAGGMVAFDSEGLAVTEAKRLAREYPKKYFVAKVIRAFECKPTVEEVKI